MALFSCSILDIASRLWVLARSSSRHHYLNVLLVCKGSKSVAALPESQALSLQKEHHLLKCALANCATTQVISHLHISPITVSQRTLSSFHPMTMQPGSWSWVERFLMRDTGFARMSRRSRSQASLPDVTSSSRPWTHSVRCLVCSTSASQICLNEKCEGWGQR